MLLAKRPELPRYLEALQQVLASDIRAAASPHDAVYLSADPDELSGLDSSSGPEFITRMATECRETWARLEHAIDAKNWPALDEALELCAFGGGFESWPAWSDGFGFGGFEHPYVHPQEPRSGTTSRPSRPKAWWSP